MRYDLHIHTKYSPCSNLKPENILKAAKKRNLDGIAVVDHNSCKGSKEVYRLNKDKDFEVIVSSEIKTNYGDVLIYYIQENFKSDDLFEVLDEAKEQDAIVSIAHPFRPIDQVKFNYPIEKIKDRIDAIEAFNGRTFFWENERALKLADKLNLSKTGGSDAHFYSEIGKVYTVFEGDFRQAIKKRKTNVQGSILINPIALALSYIKARMTK